MFCMKCGNQMPDGSSFCMQCGAKVEQSVVAQPQQQMNVQQVYEQSVMTQVPPVNMMPQNQVPPVNMAPQNQVPPVNMTQQNQVSEEKVKKKSGGAKKWGIIGGGAVLVIGAVVAGVLLLGGKDKKDDGNVPADTDAIVTGQPGENYEEGETAPSVPEDNGNVADTRTQLTVSTREVIYYEGLSDVRVVVRSGFDNPDGEIIAEAVTQADGQAVLELPMGDYTVCCEAGGYYSERTDVAVYGEEVFYTENMVPQIDGTKAYVLLEWDSDTDLDLCVYNAQANQYISIMSAVDENGNFLYSDNSGAEGYELIMLNDYTTGIYTVYVRDDASLVAGTESEMASDGVEVSVYVAEGELYEHKADPAETAALWSPMYFYDGAAIDLDEYIYDMTDYAWATRDKNVSGSDAAAQMYEAFLHGEEALNDGRYLLDLLPEHYAGELWNGYVDEIQYAYLDLGADEVPELLLTFVGMDIYAQDDDSTWEYVIRYDGAGLSVCYDFETWARSDTSVSYYGIVSDGGSNGASSHSYYEGILDAEGNYVGIYGCNQEGMVSTYQEPFYSDGFEMLPDIGLNIYEIGDSYYLVYDEWMNEGRMSYEEAVAYFEGYGYRIYSVAEWETILNEHIRTLDALQNIPEEQPSLQVQILDAQWYADYAEPDTLEISEEAREDLDDIAYALYETMNYEYGVGEWTRWDMWTYLEENMSQFLFWVYYDDAEFYESREEELGYYDYSLLDINEVSGLLGEVLAYDYDLSGLTRDENDAIGVCYEDGKLLLFFGPVGLGTGTPVFSELYEAEMDYSRVWNYAVDIDYEGEVYGQCILALRPTNNVYGYELVGCQIVLN